MITKPKFSIANEANKFFRNCDALRYFKENMNQQGSNPRYLAAMGVSIAHIAYDIIEAAIRILWSLRADPDGTLPWIKLKEFEKKGSEYGIPAKIRIDAGVIDRLMKGFESDGIDEECLSEYLKLTEECLSWIREAIELELRHNCVDDRLMGELLEALGDAIDSSSTMAHHIDYEARLYGDEKRYFIDPRIRFVLIENEEELDDDELDRLYSPRNSNTRRSLVPVYIIKLLEEESDINHRFAQVDIIKGLKRKYGLEAERKSVGKWMATLVDEDLNIWTDAKRTGYWYSEDRPDWANEYMPEEY